MPGMWGREGPGRLRFPGRCLRVGLSGDPPEGGRETPWLRPLSHPPAQHKVLGLSPRVVRPSSLGLPAPLPAVGEGKVRTEEGGQISGSSGGGEGKAVRLPKSVNKSANIYLYRYPVCMCEADR